MSPIISIIVPVFNTEQYLKSCLDSIIAQSFKNWEMILINDGSTDESGSICDLYAASDSRITTIHQNNQGQSHARNVGLDIATGEYITMVDSDDLLLSPYYLSALYKTALDKGAEICTTGFYFFEDELKIHVRDFSDEVGNAAFCGSGIEVYEKLRELPTLRYGNCMGKLFQRSLFNNLRYPEGRIAEDNAMAHRLFTPCDKVVVLSECMYGYRMNPTGTIRSADSRKLIEDTLAAFCDRVEFFKKLGLDELAKTAEMEMVQTIKIVRRIKGV